MSWGRCGGQARGKVGEGHEESRDVWEGRSMREGVWGVVGRSGKECGQGVGLGKVWRRGCLTGSIPSYMSLAAGSEPYSEVISPPWSERVSEKAD